LVRYLGRAILVELTRYDSHSAADLVPEFLELYADAYGVPPYLGDPFSSVETYRARFVGALNMEGFQIVAAREGDELLGTAHGVELPQDVAWWRSAASSAPAFLRDAAASKGVLWLRELMVRSKHRDQGIGRKLHDEFCAGRRSGYVTLTVIVDNEPARSVYLRWGYEIYAQVKHAPGSPTYDAMVRPLPI
jgi:GNAT superfamily N-acetyltransferase